MGGHYSTGPSAPPHIHAPAQLQLQQQHWQQPRQQLQEQPLVQQSPHWNQHPAVGSSGQTGQQAWTQYFHSQLQQQQQRHRQRQQLQQQQLQQQQVWVQHLQLPPAIPRESGHAQQTQQLLLQTAAPLQHCERTQ